MKKDVAEKMNSVSVTNENQGLPFNKLEELIHKKVSFDLYVTLERMQKGQTLTPTCACTGDICDFLKHNNISHDEIERLKQLVLHHKYEAIPIHFYYNRLVTQFEYELLRGGRKQKVNDVDDLTRAATALWAAQIYVCDAEMAEICKKAKINAIQTVPTIVFSTRQPELFLKHLESSIQTGSQQ